MSVALMPAKKSKSTASPAQIAANRRNATRSTGPVTAEGKAVSCRNAVKHGLRAVIPVLPGEDAEALENRRAAWIDARQPADAIELYLVETAVAASWSLDRARRLEAQAALAAQDEDDTPPAPSWRFDRNDALRTLHANPVVMLDWFHQDAEALDWMQAQWRRLDDLLDADYAWGSDDLVLALNLLGRRARCECIRIDELSRETLTAVVDSYGTIDDPESDEQWLSLVIEVLPHERNNPNIGPLTGAVKAEAFNSQEAAVDYLRMLCREQLDALASRLEARSRDAARDEIEEGDESATTPDPLAAPSAALRLRYEAQHERTLFQSLRLLDTIQQHRKREESAAEVETEAESTAPNEPNSGASLGESASYGQEDGAPSTLAVVATRPPRPVPSAHRPENAPVTPPPAPALSLRS